MHCHVEADRLSASKDGDNFATSFHTIKCLQSKFISKWLQIKSFREFLAYNSVNYGVGGDFASRFN